MSNDQAVPLVVLVLGGTAEARALAAELATDPGLRVVSSLAGRVKDPRLPVGEVRIGGFGGPEALTEWLQDNAIDAVVDATHPFAERIGASAAQACSSAGVPLLRLARPGWSASPGDDWHWVDSLDEAAGLLPALGQRVFLTSGRQGLRSFAGLDDLWFLIRCVEPPEPADLPVNHELLLARGPYTLDGEMALMRAHRIDALVTKDSGGPLTEAKLAAARALGLPVVMVRRPSRPPTAEVSDVRAAVAWVRTRANAR
jgi:precorrin-6A/cobalt-precorrin-6A reductase